MFSRYPTGPDGGESVSGLVYRWGFSARTARIGGLDGKLWLLEDTPSVIVCLLWGITFEVQHIMCCLKVFVSANHSGQNVTIARNTPGAWSPLSRNDEDD